MQCLLCRNSRYRKDIPTARYISLRFILRAEDDVLDLVPPVIAHSNILLILDDPVSNCPARQRQYLLKISESPAGAKHIEVSSLNGGSITLLEDSEK